MAASPSLLATQLGRHPSLRAVDRELVWARHPGVFDAKKGRTVVPAVHEGAQGVVSVFMNSSKNNYGDRMLPDGVTIEFHPSTSDIVNGRLDRLAGKEATLYAFLGSNSYRTGKIVVRDAPNGARGVYHLVLQRQQQQQLPPAAVARAAAAAPPRTLWADMD